MSSQAMLLRSMPECTAAAQAAWHDGAAATGIPAMLWLTGTATGRRETASQETTQTVSHRIHSTARTTGTATVLQTIPASLTAAPAEAYAEAVSPAEVTAEEHVVPVVSADVAEAADNGKADITLFTRITKRTDI